MTDNSTNGKDWPILEGRPLKNGKRVFYDTSIFGEWVKYQRREAKDMSAEEAASKLEKATGRSLSGQSEWRNKYEKMGAETPHSHVTKSGAQGTRHNPITIEKCKDVSVALGIPLQEVVAEARKHTGWGEFDKDVVDVEWDTLGFVLSGYTGLKSEAITKVKEMLAEHKAQGKEDEYYPRVAEDAAA